MSEHKIESIGNLKLELDLTSVTSAALEAAEELKSRINAFSPDTPEMDLLYSLLWAVTFDYVELKKKSGVENV